MRQTLLGVVDLAHAPVNLGDAQITFGRFRLELGKTLVLLEGGRQFVLRDQRLGESAAVAGIIGINLYCFAVGFLGSVVLLGLGVGVAEQIVQTGCLGAVGSAAQQFDGLLRLALVKQ
jgi:hypothetical protein